MRRWLIVLLIVGVVLGVVWVERHAVLASVGRLVVEEDRPAPADLAAGDIASRGRP